MYVHIGYIYIYHWRVLGCLVAAANEKTVRVHQINCTLHTIIFRPQKLYMLHQNVQELTLHSRTGE